MSITLTERCALGPVKLLLWAFHDHIQQFDKNPRYVVLHPRCWDAFLLDPLIQELTITYDVQSGCPSINGVRVQVTQGQAFPVLVQANGVAVYL